MPGRNPPLYCTFTTTLIAMQVNQNRGKRRYTKTETKKKKKVLEKPGYTTGSLPEFFYLVACVAKFSLHLGLASRLMAVMRSLLSVAGLGS